MAKYKYSVKEIGENADKAVGLSLNISTKQSINVCAHIRGRTTTAAKKILNESIALKKAVPFTRFLNGVGHKRGDMGSGSYAPKTCQEILKIVETAEANAQYKGLNSSNLVLAHVSAQKAGGQWRYGRKRRQKMKSTHIEVVVEEKALPKKEVKKKADTTKVESVKPAAPKVAEKKEAPKEVKKEPVKAPAAKKEAAAPKVAEKKEVPKEAKKEPVVKKAEPKTQDTKKPEGNDKK